MEGVEQTPTAGKGGVWRRGQGMDWRKRGMHQSFNTGSLRILPFLFHALYLPPAGPALDLNLSIGWNRGYGHT